LVHNGNVGLFAGLIGQFLEPKFTNYADPSCERRIAVRSLSTPIRATSNWRDWFQSGSGCRTIGQFLAVNRSVGGSDIKHIVEDLEDTEHCPWTWGHEAIKSKRHPSPRGNPVSALRSLSIGWIDSHRAPKSLTANPFARNTTYWPLNLQGCPSQNDHFANLPSVWIAQVW
jgi:hypothetical protein